MTGPRSLAGNIVVITGAATGIGRATARLFAREECQLVLVDIQEEALNKLAAQLDEDGTENLTIVGDITDDSMLEKLLAQVQDRFGQIDVLVNNAGLVIGGRFQDADPARLRKLVETNLYAPLRLSQLVIPMMIARSSGHIVNVFSSSALLSVPGFAAYGATKAGLYAFVRTLRRELNGSGIHITALCPGSTATAMTQDMIASGKGLGRRPHHAPDIPAKAIVDAVRYRRQNVVVSGQPLAQAVTSFLDRLCPRLMDKFWLKQADDDYYDAVSRTK
ncbi:MAG: SDR family oxidoreductase [Halieaceae bacterium]|jgi:uncharacterized protein|nr:SDR family oxidoreductase [Halieaceae bacterium]